MEPLDHDEVVGPPKKKKKKKNKSKDRSKDETPSLETQDDVACADNPAAEPVVAAEEPIPVSAASVAPAEGYQGSQEEKEEECRTQEVPIRAERS